MFRTHQELLKKVSVPLDGEHYPIWIAEQLGTGASGDEIIEELRRFTKNRYTTERLRSHIDDARTFMKNRTSKKR